MRCFKVKEQFILFTLIAFTFGACKKTEDNNIITNNIYDGVYNLSFCNYSSGGASSYPCTTTVVHLITTAPDKVKMFWPTPVAAYANPTCINSTFVYMGNQEPEYTINSGTNVVTVQNAAAGGVTFYTMAVGWPNNYDPATKTFNIKFGYGYTVPGIFDAGCKEWKQTLTYVGPR